MPDRQFLTSWINSRELQPRNEQHLAVLPCQSRFNTSSGLTVSATQPAPLDQLCPRRISCQWEWIQDLWTSQSVFKFYTSNANELWMHATKRISRDLMTTYLYCFLVLQSSEMIDSRKECEKSSDWSEMIFHETSEATKVYKKAVSLKLGWWRDMVSCVLLCQDNLDSCIIRSWGENGPNQFLGRDLQAHRQCASLKVKSIIF